MSCPFTIFVNNDNEFQANKYPAHVTDEALKKLETALKKPDKKASRFVRKFNLSSDNPIRYSYWPRLLKVEDKAVELKYKPTQEEEKLDFSCLLEKSGYEFTDAKLINNYKLNDDGVKAVRLTLHELHQQKPELVYCPELWNLCAMLMHYHGKELTMKCLNAVLSKENWISSTKDEWKAKTLSLGYYTTKSKKIGNIDYFTPFNGWIKAVWDLPFDILLLLIDSFLIEGYKVFYRAALILAIESSRKNQGEILFNTIPKEIDYPPIYFRDTIFSIRGMSRKKIQKCIGLASDFLKTKSAAFDYLVTPSVRGNELTHSNAIEAVSNTVIKTDGSKKIVQNVAYKILTPKEITDIIYHIEDENIKKVCKPNLVYASDNDGVSLNTLLEKTPNNESLIVVEVDTKPEKAVVGAFLYNRLEKKDGFYGSGKSFVFRSRPENLEVFKWNKNDEKNRFQRVTNECIEIGGGKEAHSPAIDLNDSLSLLKSGPSDVFDSPSLLYGLVKENDVKFDKEETANAKIIRVELFSFVQM